MDCREQKILFGPGVTPKKPMPRCPVGQQSVFIYLGWWRWICTMPKTLGSWAAPQTPIHRYPIGQQKCFSIPGMVVFERHNAKKIVWVLGWRPKHPNFGTSVPYRPANVSLDASDGGVKTKECQKKSLCVLGRRTKHPYLSTP